MKKAETKPAKKFNFNLYLPVFILVVAATIFISGTFAWFVDNRHADGSITFASIALSPNSGFEITQQVTEAIPGSEILNGQVKFAKAENSASIIVRARVYFEKLTGDDADLSEGIPDEWVESLNLATHQTVTDSTNDYKWTELQDDGYFYLTTTGGTGTQVKVIENNHDDVNDTKFYVFLNSLKFPTTYEDEEGNKHNISQVEGYAQYHKQLAIKVCIQAVQYDYTGVETVEQAIALFAEAFPAATPEPAD